MIIALFIVGQDFDSLPSSYIIPWKENTYIYIYEKDWYLNFFLCIDMLLPSKSEWRLNNLMWIKVEP